MLVIAGCASLLALEHLPYGYYTIIRWFVFAGSGYGAYCFARREISFAATLCVILAIVFNPLMPIRLSRAQWHPIDLLGGVVLLALAGLAFTHERSSSSSRIL
jgi:hypothetical protein